MAARDGSSQDESSPSPTRRLWVGLTLGPLVGLTYGYIVGHVVGATPGMAALGMFGVGIVVAFLVIPIALGIIYGMIMKGSSDVWLCGLLGLGFSGVIAGYVLCDNLWAG